jgi:hypothetical protein
MKSTHSETWALWAVSVAALGLMVVDLNGRRVLIDTGHAGKRQPTWGGLAPKLGERPAAGIRPGSTSGSFPNAAATAPASTQHTRVHSCAARPGG